ncbi:MAG: alpha/beta hydrolase [Holophaga sp.]|nr:alpha/beta hydrolase [Holophaga sp.]
MRMNVRDIQIAYTDRGSGIPLVFLHGFPLNRDAWSKQVDAFRIAFRVIVPDLRGFGESESSRGAVSMSCFAEDLLTLLQHLKTGPIILVGHSMGGYIALAFAKAFPQMLRGLVLVGTKAAADSPEAAEARRGTAEKVRLEGVSVVVDPMAVKMLSSSNTDSAMASSVRALMTSSKSEGLVSALLGMAERQDAGAWLETITVPTLIITGADDMIIPPGESEVLAKAIPNATLKVIPEAGHLVAFEQADAFNEILREWFSLPSSVTLGPSFESSSNQQ